MISNERWLQHLIDHLPVALEGSDPEGVHQVRSAAGRLDVWLRLAGWRVLRPDLKWLRSSASAVRDLDVLMMRELPDTWRHHLQSRHAPARDGLKDVLVHPRVAGLVFALASAPAIPRKLAIANTERLARSVAKQGERLRKDGGALEECHRLRRRLRRLRFAIEWLGRKPKSLKKLTTAFGDLNDSSVAVQYFTEFSQNGHSLPDFDQYLRTELGERKSRALKAWRTCALRLDEPLSW